MVLRHSGRVGSRRFYRSLQNLIVLEAFFRCIAWKCPPPVGAGSARPNTFRKAFPSDTHRQVDASGRADPAPTGKAYRLLMQAISLSTSSSVVSNEVTSLISPTASFQK